MSKHVQAHLWRVAQPVLHFLQFGFMFQRRTRHSVLGMTLWAAQLVEILHGRARSGHFDTMLMPLQAMYGFQLSAAMERSLSVSGSSCPVLLERPNEQSGRVCQYPHTRHTGWRSCLRHFTGSTISNLQVDCSNQTR